MIDIGLQFWGGRGSGGGKRSGGGGGGSAGAGGTAKVATPAPAAQAAEQPAAKKQTLKRSSQPGYDDFYNNRGKGSNPVNVPTGNYSRAEAVVKDAPVGSSARMRYNDGGTDYWSKTKSNVWRNDRGGEISNQMMANTATYDAKVTINRYVKPKK